MKDMLKLGFILAIFAVVACVALALVNDVTAPAIAAAKEAEANEGMKVVFPSASTFVAATNFTPDTSTAVKVEKLYIAKNGDKVLGAVAHATGPTYDKATMLIGVDMDRKITSVAFLALGDTPGYGQKAKDPAWIGQFNAKSVDDAFEVKQDVNIITGATISSKGIAQLIKYAATVAGKHLSTQQ